jgi:hypothetical protein
MCGPLVYDDIYNSANNGLYISHFATANPPALVGSIWIISHFTVHTCVAVSDPLLAVQNYSM